MANTTVLELYFEADRTAQRELYQSHFGGEKQDSDDAEEADDSSGSNNLELDEQQEDETEKGISLSADVLDSEFDELLLSVNTPEWIHKTLKDEWAPLPPRRKAEAIWHLYTLFSDDFTLPYSWEGITHFFSPIPASHFLHGLYPHCIFWLGGTELSYGAMRHILDSFGIQFDDSKELSAFEVWQNLSAEVQDFSEERKLEPWQIFAILNDLGPRLLPPRAPYPTDPPPRVWMIAVNDRAREFAEVDRHDESFIGTWPINRKAKRGDLALLYCVAPRSAIVALYRVVEDAHRDPFSGWTGYRATISDRIRLPWIKIGDMKADPALSQWKLLKGNFQGLLQVELPENIWSRLVEIIAEREPDVAQKLHQFRDAGRGTREIKTSSEAWSEKDVEDRFVIPVLERIGWKLGVTLVQQVEMQIKVGAGKPKNVLADFVGYHGALTSRALLVVEVKRHIGSTKDLELAVEQAESYCGKLRCTRFAVAAPEGFWIYDLQFPGRSAQLHNLELSSIEIEKTANELEKLLRYEVLRGET